MELLNGLIHKKDKTITTKSSAESSSSSSMKTVAQVVDRNRDGPSEHQAKPSEKKNVRKSTGHRGMTSKRNLMATSTPPSSADMDLDDNLDEEEDEEYDEEGEQEDDDEDGADGGDGKERLNG